MKREGCTFLQKVYISAEGAHFLQISAEEVYLSATFLRKVHLQKSAEGTFCRFLQKVHLSQKAAEKGAPSADFANFCRNLQSRRAHLLQKVLKPLHQTPYPHM
jgi:hypothetical protein